MPLQHRHGYAADLHRGLPAGDIEPTQEFPAPTSRGVRAALQPRSVRFELVDRLEGRSPLVPHVRLSVSLAGPGPSGGAGPSRRCQGCSPPSRLSRVRLPSASPAAATDTAVEAFHHRTVQSASWRTVSCHLHHVPGEPFRSVAEFLFALNSSGVADTNAGPAPAPVAARGARPRHRARRAARALGYTPSAISQQLGVLEREAGTALLERVGRNVRLTAAGQVLVRHATILLNGMEAAEAELADARGRPGGRTGPGGGVPVRVPAHRGARRAHAGPPGLDVRVEAAEIEVEARCRRCGCSSSTWWSATSTTAQPRAVHADPAARAAGPGAHPDSCCRPTTPRRDTHRVPMRRLADLSPGPAANRVPGTTRCRCGSAAGSAASSPTCAPRSDDFLILLELVRTAGACAMLLDLALGYGAPGVAVRPPAEGSIGREIFLLTRRARTPAVAVVAAALREAAESALPGAAVPG